MQKTEANIECRKQMPPKTFACSLICTKIPIFSNKSTEIEETECNNRKINENRRTLTC